MRRIVICAAILVGIFYINVLTLAEDSSLSNGIEQLYTTQFRWNKLGTCPEYSEVASISIPFNRFDDLSKPGNYFAPPYGERTETTAEDREYIGNILSEYLNPKYYSENVLDSIISFIPKKLSRKEFFFEIESNNLRIRFSGCYGKFAHLYIFTNYDSKAEFMSKAQKYYNLPELRKENVVFNDTTDITGAYDFFYSYRNSSLDFNLSGYPYLLLSVDENDNINCDFEYVILDLTVYAEEE